MCSPADRLPVHLISHIVDKLWIRDKFRVMRVSKEWLDAATQVIRKQERLVLTVTADCFDDEDDLPVRDADEIRETYCQAVFSGIQMMGIKARKEPVGMWKSLMRMDQLQTLIIDRGKHEEHATVIPIIRKNSLTLKYLRFQNFGQLRDVFFPELETLVCGDLFDACIQSAPFLKALVCGEVSRHVLLRLPHDLTSLTACFRQYPGPDVSKICILTRFKRLHNLSLHMPFLLLPHQFFASFTRLTSVTIVFEVGRREAQTLPLMDQAFVSLIEKNDGLQEMVLQGVVLSDKFMLAVSQLPLLTSLCVTHCINSHITTAGVVALIRGRSRLLMHELRLMTSEDLDVDFVTQELEALRLERGSRLRARITSPYFCHTPNPNPVLHVNTPDAR